ncbi:MAG: YdeI/OmpD-associated family protein [Chitinophagaceae bacterium]|nr:YdeI/OmpD-associated family protein [Chitinophagaceae bacterium]
MYQKDPKVEEYILKSADFAKPILQHLRKLVVMGCPAVQEPMKWSFSNSTYKGSILCYMAAFKQHCSFGFSLGSVIKDPHNILTSEEKTPMDNFGQIKSVADLRNDNIVVDYIKQAVQLTDEGVKLPRKEKTKEALEPPPSFIKTLADQKIAEANYNKFTPSHKREYIEWINDAKTEPTRNKRIAEAIHWLQDGKSRNWKYEKC